MFHLQYPHVLQYDKVGAVHMNIHMDHPNHNIVLENMNTLSVEHKWFEWGVKEAIYIRAQKPSLSLALHGLE